MDKLQESIREFLTGELRPIHKDRLLAELTQLSKAAPDAYPQASHPQIVAAIDSLVEDGLVSVVGGRVAIIRDADKPKGEGMLF